MSEIIVKPLEWLSDRSPFFASSPFCRYRIAPVDDDTGPHWQTSVSYQGSTYRRSETEAEAKAAAQSDYEQGILSAIDLEAHKALIAARDAEIGRLRDALGTIASMSNWQIGVPIDTEAANEHARIAQSMADSARASLNASEREG